MKPWPYFLLTLALVVAGCRHGESGDSTRLEQTPAATLPAPAPGRPGIIPVTPANARIEFTGSTAITSQTGHFTSFDGTLELPSDDPKEAKIHVVVDMNSTATSVGLLTRHLKGEDFFDVTRFPQAEFVSEKVIPASEAGQYRVAGTFTIHGVKKTIEFPARIVVAPTEVSFDGTITIRQTEFDMTEAARKTRDEVAVRVSIRGRRQ